MDKAQQVVYKPSVFPSLLSVFFWGAFDCMALRSALLIVPDGSRVVWKSVSKLKTFAI